jgi:hypothetical protein
LVVAAEFPIKAVMIAYSYTGNLSETKELLDLALRRRAEYPMRRRQLSEAAEALDEPNRTNATSAWSG